MNSRAGFHKFTFAIVDLWVASGVFRMYVRSNLKDRFLVGI